MDGRLRHAWVRRDKTRQKLRQDKTRRFDVRHWKDDGHHGLRIELIGKRGIGAMLLWMGKLNWAVDRA